MNIEDMRKILHLAQSQNIQTSSAALHVTPGALSKNLKRIEQALNTTLFERVGRNIQLNTNGDKFVAYASKLVHEFDQMQSEFSDHTFINQISIIGPSVLLNHCLDDLLSKLTPLNVAVNLLSAFEGDAVNQVANGQCHLAIVTSEAISEMNTRGLTVLPLGRTSFQVAASKMHPLFTQKHKKIADDGMTMSAIAEFPFVCPVSSPFCGVIRGIGSDGWPDNKYPRKIRYRTDDFNTLLNLVKQGRAIAFVPDVVIKSNQLELVKLADFHYQYQESYCLVYKPSTAFGWLNKLIASLKKY